MLAWLESVLLVHSQTSTEHAVLQFAPRFVPTQWHNALTQMLHSTDRSLTRSSAMACAVTVRCERCPVLHLPTFSRQTLCNPASVPTSVAYPGWHLRGGGGADSWCTMTRIVDLSTTCTVHTAGFTQCHVHAWFTIAHTDEPVVTRIS